MSDEPIAADGRPTIILTQDQVIRVLGACARIEEIHAKLMHPTEGLFNRVTVAEQELKAMKEREQLRKEEEAKRDNWHRVFATLAGGGLVTGVIALLKTVFAKGG